MTDMVSVMFDQEARKVFLSKFRENIIQLQREQDAENTQRLRNGKTGVFMVTYNLALKRFDENANGTPIQQMLLVYILFFYTTHTEHYFSETTQAHVLNKITAAAQVLPDGSVAIHSELYDRTRLIVDGDPDAHSRERDYKDMQYELIARNHNPLGFLLDELMRIAPLLTTTS